MSDREEQRRLAARAGLLKGIILLLFLGILARYLDIMVLRHEEYRAQALDQRSRSQRLQAVRGSIRDRQGRVVALTRAIPSVAVDPSLVPLARRAAFARYLAGRLELDPAGVRAALAKSGRFQWLRRVIREPRILERIEELRRHRPVVVKEEMVRCYPAAPVGVHLVGCMGVVNAEEGRITGVTGAERAFDAALRASEGRRTVLRDGKAATLYLPVKRGDDARKRRNGRDVKLAMDLTIQTFVEEMLDETVRTWKPEQAVVVVLDPRNGDVLALAGRPVYDPHDLKHASPGALQIRAVTDAYEVGSVIKPLIAAAALDQGVVSYDEPIDCTETGAWRVRPGRKRVLRDYKVMGVLPFMDVLVQSSNIGIAKVADRLGPKKLYRHLRALGFGQSTRSGLPGESPGGGAASPKKTWREGDTLISVAFGHEILITPLQFATAFAVLANGGYLYRPRIAVEVGGREIPVRALRQPVSTRVARELLIPALERVVNEGTGTRARIPGYRVCGKTGTAQVKEGDVVTGYTSSFVAFAPAEAPRFLVYVLLHRPRTDGESPSGGNCAAPCAREILERCLGYAGIPPSDTGASRGSFGTLSPDAVGGRNR